MNNELNLTNNENGNENKPIGNKFDLDRLRLSQDFTSFIGVKKGLLTVPVRKPDRQWFIRTHPSETYRLTTCVLELKSERETYLVDPSLWDKLSNEITPKILFTSMNRQGDVFLWPVKVLSEDSRKDHWSQTILHAAKIALQNWVRVVPNMSIGAYEVIEAIGDVPAPQWPTQSFQELLELAFKDRFITTYDHPVLKQLRGESI